MKALAFNEQYAIDNAETYFGLVHEVTSKGLEYRAISSFLHRRMQIIDPHIYNGVMRTMNRWVFESRIADLHMMSHEAWMFNHKLHVMFTEL
jgi:hypothetical protein